MPLAPLFALFVLVACFSISAAADEPPPAGCFSPVPDNTLEIEGDADVKAWIGQRSGSTWDACLRLKGCIWRVQDASAKLPIIRPYLIDALVHPKCKVRWVNSRTTSECEKSPELAASLANFATLIADSLGGTNGICAEGADKIFPNNIDVFESGGSPWNRYWIPVDGWCIEGYVRLSDGATSLVIGKGCTAGAAGWSSFAGTLSSNGFPQSNSWLLGQANGFVFGRSVDLTISPISLGGAHLVAGDLQEAYVASWLQNASDAANSGPSIDRTDDPLPSVSGRQGRSGKFLHWLAAASSRLNTIPFDISSGWDDPESRRARKWSALIDLSEEPYLRGTHFRAELARKP
ncbi:hypothetical protein [Roseibium aggregatum]|uniref:hypothetical protein n=1 Tax=Roseibium aggregatum TaxID=187304 RepID=UPI001E286F11|nr:hypothetical protein [Roseibium aggregatum]UES49915.1 hypothetical protein GFK88_09990 [Roseibium aggregatum]